MAGWLGTVVSPRWMGGWVVDSLTDWLWGRGEVVAGGVVEYRYLGSLCGCRGAFQALCGGCLVGVFVRPVGEEGLLSRFVVDGWKDVARLFAWWLMVNRIQRKK